MIVKCREIKGFFFKGGRLEKLNLIDAIYNWCMSPMNLTQACPITFDWLSILIFTLFFIGNQVPILQLFVFY